MRKLLKLYKQGNVCTVGLRGSGKDMLTANIIARRGMDYISNTDYHITCKSRPRLFAKKHKPTYIPLDLGLLDCGKNSYKNFIENDIKAYTYCYPEDIDIFISDCGVYFPSQYSGLLDRDYPYFTTFMALSRHLGNCNVHFNVQNLNRVWNKIREQSDIYIMCNKCLCLFGKIVFQTVTVYDNAESCQKRVEPYKHIKPPLFSSSEVRAEYLARDEVLFRQFTNTYGSIKRRLLIYINHSKYDTRIFKKILKGGS